MKKTHEFLPADRYCYDFKVCTIAKGFAQVDTEQDASYYGTWANPFKLITFAYVEGDCYTNEAETPAEFVEHLRGIKSWNESQGYKFHGIDPGFNEALKAEFVALGLADLIH